MDRKELKVLLIESQLNVAEEISKDLSSQGFKVSTSISTASGLLRAKAYHYDLFIVNCSSDGKQGLNFAKTIIKENEYSDVPFLFLINPKLKVDIRLRKFNHQFEIIRLPFDSTEMLIRLNRLLEEPKVIEETPKEEIKTTTKDDAKVGKILLVEDNPLNQKVLGMFISKLGYEHDVASNGLIAVELTNKEQYRFILMDIYMPGMDGTEATVKIRENEQKGNHRAKIIAITANESEESVKRCYDSGMDDYLVKPFTLDVLNEKLV